MAAQNSTLDLTELSLEDLMSIEVTLPSRKAEKLSKSTAAIFVLTHEDIKRTSATSLPDVLRLVPGIQVSQLDANKWAVSSRSGNSVLSNKLLVLVDGQSVYTPIFSGVTWDSQDLLLDNIERIEVVRGPGGSLWGANAVNGVINIITKHSRNTQGTSIVTGSGTHNKQLISIVQGGRFDKNSYYQLYAKTHHRNAFELKNRQDASDQWEMNRLGFRTDLESYNNTIFCLQGEIYAGRANQTLDVSGMWTDIFQNPNERIKISGGHFLARMNRQISRHSEMTAQLSFDRMQRIDWNLMGGDYDQIDFDFQHQKKINWKHSLLWGGGYRWTEDHIDSTALGYFQPASRNYQIISAFVQDHIQVNRDILRMTIGTKFEYNDFSGFEVQPSIRALYTPNNKMTTWAALSRAVRTPSRADHDFRALYQQSDTLSVQLRGTHDVESEQIIAIEFGQRFHYKKELSIDVSIFYNRYDNLRSFEPRTQDIFYSSTRPDVKIFPFETDNKLKTQTMGLEVVIDSYINSKWRLRSSYSFLNVDTDLSASSNLVANQSEKENAQHKAYAWSSWDCSCKTTADIIFRYMGALPALKVSSYITCDIRFGWQPTHNIQLSLNGRNLIGNSHIEHYEPLIAIQSSYIQRSVFGAIEWHF